MWSTIKNISCRWESKKFKSIRQTKWKQSTKGPPLWHSEYGRSVTPLCLINSGKLNPLGQEVDVTGVVLRVGEPETKHQTVHLVDHHFNIIPVNFFGGLKVCTSALQHTSIYTNSSSHFFAQIVCFRQSHGTLSTVNMYFMCQVNALFWYQYCVC